MDFKHEYQRRLNLALQFIENNYSENILLDDIAAAAHFSSYHFHRIFSSMCDESPTAYLRRIRLEKAALLLRMHPDYSVKHVISETGFSSPSVFSRAFIDRFGISASEFRKKTRTQNHKLIVENNSHCVASPKNVKEYNVQEIRHLPALKIAYVRSMKGYGPGIGKAWNRLMSWAYAKNVINAKTHMFGIPLDDPEITPKNKCRFFAAISVDEEVKIDSPIESMVLEPGMFAVFDFQGKASDISPFYEFLYGVWLPQSGYLPENRPSLEEYSMNCRVKYDPKSKENIFSYSLLLPIRLF